MKQALLAAREALLQMNELASSENWHESWFKKPNEALALIDSALAQPEQEPDDDEYRRGYEHGVERAQQAVEESRVYKEQYFKLLDQVVKGIAMQPTPPILVAAPVAQPQCSPTMTECPRCKNDITKCDGVFAPVAQTNQMLVEALKSPCSDWKHRDVCKAALASAGESPISPA